MSALCNNSAMSENQGLEYYDVQDVLDRATPGADPADSHGLLCGLICAAGFADPQRWLPEVFDDFNPRDAAQARAYQCLQSVYEHTLASLHSEDLDFELLIPDDEAPLAERTESLGAWCSGFLSGLGLGGLPDQDKMSEELAERLEEMAQIARVDFDLEDPGEDENVSFEEVVEYLRIGVLFIHDELQPAAAPQQIQ
jgi:yecA family protein